MSRRNPIGYNLSCLNTRKWFGKKDQNKMKLRNLLLARRTIIPTKQMLNQW